MQLLSHQQFGSPSTKISETSSSSFAKPSAHFPEKSQFFNSFAIYYLSVDPGFRLTMLMILLAVTGN
jgi:hypothetical protein